MTGALEVRVPDIGDFNDVPVIEVLVKPGARIEADTPLITLESEKATMDVPAPIGGVVKEVMVQPGQRVSRGSLILTLADNAEVPSEPINIESAQPGPGAEMPAPTLPSPPPPSETLTTVANEPPYTSPSVRARCRALEIDAKEIPASGSNGRILESDLDAFLEQRLRESTGVSQFAPAPAFDYERFGPIERRPLSRVAIRAAGNLVRNWATIPHVTNFEEADVTDLETFRDSVNREEQSATKLTVLSFLIKASASALREFPEINVSLADDTMIRKQYWHIGFATDTTAGLVVPVIRDVDRKGLRQIAAEVSELASRAREGKLSGFDMAGGCFTISSLGAVSGTGFTPIINAPEIAILGAARARLLPRWDGKQFVPRLILPLALSWDHRAVSGAPVARFLSFLARCLADPRLLLL